MTNIPVGPEISLTEIPHERKRVIEARYEIESDMIRLNEEIRRLVPHKLAEQIADQIMQERGEELKTQIDVSKLHTLILAETVERLKKLSFDWPVHDAAQRLTK